jgi:tellurite methyltransferase
MDLNKTNPYDERYSGEEYYWGKKHSAICDTVIGLFGDRLDSHPKLLDLGCGEGRNAVYFALHGFEVTGMDASQVGLEKTERYAREAGVRITTVQSDIAQYRPDGLYDVIFSSGTLHYIPTELRTACLNGYKDATSADGLHAFSALTEKPFIPQAPDAAPDVVLFKSGELMGYYWDWAIHMCEEDIFDCLSSGVPHKHASSRIIAWRYGCGLQAEK